MLIAKLNIEGRLLQVVPLRRLRHCGLLQQDRHHKMYDLPAKLVKGGSLVSAEQ